MVRSPAASLAAGAEQADTSRPAPSPKARRVAVHLRMGRLLSYGDPTLGPRPRPDEPPVRPARPPPSGSRTGPIGPIRSERVRKVTVRVGRPALARRKPASYNGPHRREAA